MPLTAGFTSRISAKGEGHIHTDKWHRCIEHVKAQGGDYEPHAVCTASIGYSGSINPDHRTKGPHDSTKHRKKKIDYAKTLKWNESEHARVPAGSATGGEFTAGGGAGKGKGSTLTASQQAMQDELAKRDAMPVHKVKTAEEAVQLVLKGQNVEIEDTKDVHTVLQKLGEMAIKAKELGEKAPSFDPCLITVKHVSLFCTEKLKTEDFPHGIPRIEMPQFRSKTPIPGSEADKLPRDKDGEVNATQEFLKYLTEAGVTTNPNGHVLARKLKASQAEMEGVKVAGMMLNPSFDPKASKIWVSKDGYVIDGHHTWAAAIGRDAEDGDLDNDKKMDVVVVNMPMSEVYHVANKWTKAFGLPGAGVKKFERMLRYATQ